MRRSILAGLALFACGLQTAQAQTATDSNEGMQVAADATTGAQVLTWWGRSGRTYFVQQSYDLITWTYVPVVHSGGGSVDGLNFACTDSRQFWRLRYTDAALNAPSAASADFDGDGLTNQQELNLGADPFNPDTDGDGFGDGTESLAQTNATSAASNPETDLNDVPKFKDAFLLDSSGYAYYSVAHSVLQSEYSTTSWLVSENSTIRGNIYSTSYMVTGGQPSVPVLPASPVPGSSLDMWSSYSTVGNSCSASLSRLVEADTSGPGFFTGNYIIGRKSLLVGTAIKYKLKVIYPSRNVRTVKVVEQKTKLPAVYNATTAGADQAGSQVVTGAQVRTLTLLANAKETEEIILQPDDADANFMTVATAAKALFITPAGDPIKGPVDADSDNDSNPNTVPDGSNEFTFSGATTGVLTLKCKVRVPGIVDQSAADQAKYTFSVDAIGSSTLSWDTAGGQATVSGEYLTANATFTGLPQNNSDFGSKTVRLKFNGNEVANAKFEAFFMRDEKNHPGNGSGNNPNWFYYWGQAAGTGTLNVDYGGATSTIALAETVGGTRWSWNSMQDKTKVIFYDEVKLADDQYGVFGDNYRTGIDSFFSVLLHEQKHVKQIADADALLGNLVSPGTPWQFGWSFNTDNQFGLNSNHYTLGNDGKPGVKGYDDDGDGNVDNLIATGRGELGYKLSQISNPPASLVETDDVELELGGNNRIDWPKSWPAPQDYANIRTHLYLELDAINAAKVHAEDQSASQDWANPGKQHDTKLYDD